MTQSSQYALAGLCNVAQEFCDLGEIAQRAGKDATLLQAIEIARQLSAGHRKPNAPPTTTLPLKSIFSTLTADGHTPKVSVYWPALPLAMDGSALFPVPASQLRDAKEQLDALRKQINDAVKLIRDPLAGDPDNESLLESLLLLMQRYLVPVPANDAEDTSLYDHARMTGALTAVIADLDDATRQRLATSDLMNDATPVAMLIGGDLSGIQDFIYTITSRGAASALRGRSFYLQLLTDAVMRYTLRELQLPITNVVYAGGGKFYLLARARDGERLPAIQRHVSDVLLRHHGGDLYLSIQGVPLAAKDFFEGRISKRWEAVLDKQQRAKQRRFEELGAGAFKLFTQQGAGGTLDKQCQVCGKEHPRTALDKTVRKCPECKSYERLGDDLRNARFLAYGFTKLVKSERSGDYENALREFGMVARALWSAEKAADIAGDTRVIFALDEKGLDDLKEAKGASVGRRFIANVVPRLFERDIEVLTDAGVELNPEPLGTVKTFDGMAEQAQGIKRLGVLRMDVDNAGKLFSQGLAEKATLARIAHLSFAINIFFEGWVAHLAKTQNEQERLQHPELGERLYAVYCGGDDVFFVGAWDAIMVLAAQIRTDLARYANHPGIHVSAGVALITGKHPLFRAAQEADEAEKQAKQSGKNAITFLGVPLRWDDFERTHQNAERFAVWCGKGGVLNRSFLQTLQALHFESDRAQKVAAKQGKKPQYSRATWLAAYQLTRLIEDKRVKDTDAAREVEQIRDSLQEPKADTRSLALSARWAQYMLRTSTSRNKEEA